MLTIADHEFSSRLFTGTGKFARPDLMAAAIEASGSRLVTMAIKRLEPGKRHDDILTPLLALGVKLLPNTSGAKTLSSSARSINPISSTNSATPRPVRKASSATRVAFS